MKKTVSAFLTLTAVLMVLGCMTCFASVISPQGPGQIGFSSVVLCSTLSLRSEPELSSATLQTLQYGDRIIVMSRKDGWAEVVLGDSEDAVHGWVDEDFLVVDPAWYQTEEDTPVYAWDDTSAPKVALLDKGTVLPILKDEGDWIVVSLRGAAGWIDHPDRSASQSTLADIGGISQSNP